MGKFRPQVFSAIMCGTIVSIVALYVGLRMEAVEIVTAVVGAIFGFLAGISFKILEGE
tara:strand:+ start:64 stop:237 length:174 start_codon:yes stop_codon:yes gene_type:complete